MTPEPPDQRSGLRGERAGRRRHDREPEAPVGRPRRARLRGACRHHRTAGASGGGAGPARSHPARHQHAGDGRLRGLPAAQGVRAVEARAGDLPHGVDRHRRQGPGVRRGRRRLRHQAFSVRGSPGAGEDARRPRAGAVGAGGQLCRACAPWNSCATTSCAWSSTTCDRRCSRCSSTSGCSRTAASARARRRRPGEPGRPRSKRPRSLSRMANDLFDVSRLEECRMPVDAGGVGLDPDGPRRALGARDPRRVAADRDRQRGRRRGDLRRRPRPPGHREPRQQRHQAHAGRQRACASPSSGATAARASPSRTRAPACLRRRASGSSRSSARSTRRYHSAGLGLAFCKLAVEAHGGTIGVEPREPAGSTFWFELPA